jgi:hypothetical protein
LSFTIDVDALEVKPALTRNFSFVACHLKDVPSGFYMFCVLARKKVVELEFVRLQVRDCLVELEPKVLSLSKLQVISDSVTHHLICTN